jgi:hypothetical protein
VPYKMKTTNSSVTARENEALRVLNLLVSKLVTV